MSVEYAPKGLIGLLTPQANTTVEPEHYILLPAGYAHINARLMSDKSTIEARLVDYVDRLNDACTQFANAPIGAVAVGCTGASYLVGREREAEVLARIEHERGVPAFTAATAVVAALNQLGARRVALASPYPAGLTAASKAYWESQGFAVSRIASADMDHSQFHPIYSMKADTAGALLDDLASDDTDAILMLGTGMPTLAPLLAANARSRVPVLSCMLCLAWMGVSSLEGYPVPLAPWLTGGHWRERLAAQQA
ncbi:MAG: aspartate/glutamate racemase family protein [Pigmentiphaga sp.]|uniref:maleate cis-trans isomerase family protein n=1 Tax=Pigmentiphaga sp. TaxID=1977564 RepID=UPI0029B851E2|nr:aspartate/glutamate racemase family protein [Pigmentiphaga sp.]MDX3905858.1 aspartate/glutamate racemase family protein [Pigmentiphaga sp.]